MMSTTVDDRSPIFEGDVIRVLGLGPVEGERGRGGQLDAADSGGSEPVEFAAGPVDGTGQ